MNIISITVAAVAVSVLAVAVRRAQAEMGQLLSIAASVVFFGVIIPYAAEAVNSIKEFSAYTAAGHRYITPVLKITGISYITQLGSDICTDAGEKALAGRVEMAGKLLICMITIPIARETFVKITGIMK